MTRTIAELARDDAKNFNIDTGRLELRCRAPPVFPAMLLQ
jgi:hypothetical protein